MKCDVLFKNMVLIRKEGSDVLLTIGDSILYFGLNSQDEILLKVPEPILPENLTKGQIEVLKKEERNITALDFNNKNDYIVVSTENKQVVVYDKHLNVIRNFIVNRTASKVCFTPDSDILVADKTGDVYLYKLNSEKEHPQLLLGHLSVIIDMVLSECGKYIITCDRDEKIRVSCFPNAYNIVSFCLGHTEFVTSVKVVKNILVSASGDGTVRLWNYLEGEQQGIINTNDHISDSSLLNAFVKEMDKEKVDVVALPVTDMQVHFDGTKLYIAVSLYSYSAVQVYTVDLSNFTSSYVGSVEVSRCQFYFCLSDELYVFSDKFAVFKLSDLSEINVSILDKLFDKHKAFLCKSEDSTVTMLYKRKFDNVQEYLERKRQRLEGK